jgi:hypothetical protein
MGKYQHDKGMQINFPGSNVERRKNMGKLNLRIMNVVTQKLKIPFEEYLQEPIDTHLDTFNRFNFVLMLDIRNIYNLT